LEVIGAEAARERWWWWNLGIDMGIVFSYASTAIFMQVE